MSTISDARLDVAETLSAALPGLPVWAYPPNNMSAPCAFVQLGAGLEQPIADKWNAELVVTLIGPGGDNDVAIVALEKMIMDAAQAISAAHLAPVTWATPGVLTIAGTPYFSARLTVPIDVEPTSAVTPPDVYGPPITGYEADATAYHDDGAPHAAGNTFTVSAGKIVGLRFFRDTGEPVGARAVRLYSDTGALLATSVPSDAGNTQGWIDLALDAPVIVTQGQTVKAVIDRPVGYVYATGTATHTPHIAYASGWLGAELGSNPPDAIGGTTYATDIILQVKQ